MPINAEGQSPPVATGGFFLAFLIQKQGFFVSREGQKHKSKKHLEKHLESHALN